MKNNLTRRSGSRLVLGCVSSLTMLGFACSEGQGLGDLLLVPIGGEWGDCAGTLFYLLLSALFLLSAFRERLGHLQAGIFLLLSALQAGRESGRQLGLGFAIVAMIVLMQRGWFIRRRRLKAAIASAFGCAIFLGPALASGGGDRELLPAAIWWASYVVVVLGLSRHRYLSALGPRKGLLKLADYKLTARESRIVRMRLLGLSSKEVAAELSISDSTVRNVLSTAYRKLGIENWEALLSMGERYTVE